MASSSRSVHPEERRAVLEALQTGFREVALPFVIPKFPSAAGRKPAPQYAAASTTARRGATPPSVFEMVMLRCQRSANVARRRLARASGVEPKLYSEEEVSFSMVINVITPIGHVIGFEDPSVLAQLAGGRNRSEALDRLCRLEHPFPTPPTPAAATTPAMPPPPPYRTRRQAAPGSVRASLITSPHLTQQANAPTAPTPTTHHANAPPSPASAAAALVTGLLHRTLIAPPFTHTHKHA
jgi:hypothetical protein